MNKVHIKKNDQVFVLTGKDRDVILAMFRRALLGQPGKKPR